MKIDKNQDPLNTILVWPMINSRLTMINFHSTAQNL
jgi:hypothetical protein